MSVRRAMKRKSKVGDMVSAQTIRVRHTGEFYWFECAKDFDRRDGIPPDAVLHGPFKTEAEVNESQRVVLLGPQCEVTEGGNWDSAWDRLQ
jgi:hypothetical protein